MKRIVVILSVMLSFLVFGCTYGRPNHRIIKTSNTDRYGISHLIMPKTDKTKEDTQNYIEVENAGITYRYFKTHFCMEPVGPATKLHNVTTELSGNFKEIVEVTAKNEYSQNLAKIYEVGEILQLSHVALYRLCEAVGNGSLEAKEYPYKIMDVFDKTRDVLMVKYAAESGTSEGKFKTQVARSDYLAVMQERIQTGLEFANFVEKMEESLNKFKEEKEGQEDSTKRDQYEKAFLSADKGAAQKTKKYNNDLVKEEIKKLKAYYMAKSAISETPQKIMEELAKKVDELKETQTKLLMEHNKKRKKLREEAEKKGIILKAKK